MKIKHRAISTVLFIIYLCLVAWCCFGHFDDIPGVKRTMLGIETDKVAHFLMFLPFPILCYWTFGSRFKKKRTAALSVAVVFIAGCLVAAMTEIGQSFTSYRSADPKDFLADALSLAFSSLVVLIWISCSRKR